VSIRAARIDTLCRHVDSIDTSWKRVDPMFVSRHIAETMARRTTEANQLDLATIENQDRKLEEG